MFFGLKNGFGNLWRMPDDEFCQVNSDKTMTHLVAPSIYGSWTIGNASGMIALSKSPGGGEGWNKSLSMEHLENFCTQIGATESTYLTCYFWNTSGATSGFRLCLRGGDASNGGLCGLSSLHVSLLSRFPMWATVRPSAKQHPSGHWNQCITRRPRVDRGVLT